MEDKMNITSTKMLANALRNERKKRKLSQSKTAETIGLKQSTVSEFENYLKTVNFCLFQEVFGKIHKTRRYKQP